MKITSAYKVKIKEYNHIFKDSVSVYRKALDFFIDVCLNEWDNINIIKGIKSRQSYIESLTVTTGNRPSVKYDFKTADVMFDKFPCYMRRSVIREAIGKVSSYRSNLSNWETSDPHIRGERPSLPKAGNCYPVLYRGNMYQGDIFTGYEAQIKVYRNNTWDWLTVKLHKSDVDYIKHHCQGMKDCCPSLMRKGKQWFLTFSFMQDVKLNETDIKDQVILAADLGINNSCTCSVMTSDGTVLGRKFYKLPREYDSLNHKIGHIKRAQHHGSHKVTNLWSYAKGINNDIAVKTANFIIDTAILYNVDVIVFEYLDLNKKKKGSHKQKLALWKARYVQEMVTHKAHVNGMRISHVNAWGTSKLAYDGSGMTLRGKDANLNSYSLCKFTSGKVYNCDLNASYNIGARYFLREILKSLPVRDRQRIEAKVPQCVKRSTCTLATLISLNGVLRSDDLSYAV